MQEDFISFDKVCFLCKTLADQIYSNSKRFGGINSIVAINKDSLVPASLLANYLNVNEVQILNIQKNKNSNYQEAKRVYPSDCKRTLFISNICRSGKLLTYIKNKYPNSVKAVLFYRDGFNLSYLFDYGAEILKDKEKRIKFSWQVDSVKELEKQEFQRQAEIIYNTPIIDDLSLVDIKLPIERKESSLINLDQDYKSGEGVYLSLEQKKVINWVESRNETLILLTGKAGAGKSTIIKELLSRNPTWGICSTTGRSALLVGGITVDKMFCYNRDDNSINEFVCELSMTSCGKVIIVDEASMMGKSMFETIYKICLKYRKKLLLVGDWGQAAPVKDDWIFKSDLFLNNVVCIKLKDTHRQQDSQFLDVLNKIRIGQVDEQVNSILQSRTILMDEDDDSRLRIFGTRSLVAQYNDSRIVKCAESNKTNIFTLSGSAKVAKSLEVPERRLQSLLYESNLAHEEKLCYGCKVLLTINNVEQGYVNGDTGILLERKNNAFKVLLDRNESIVDVAEAKIELKNAKKQTEIVLLGYPIKAGYAFTAHKCQGLTIPKVYVDIEDIRRMRSHGLCYVALSRVRSLDDLYLSSWDPRAVICEDIVKPYL